MAYQSETKDGTPVFHFRKPTKNIKLPSDMTSWQRSQAYKDYFSFVRHLNESVKGKTTSDRYPVSPAVETATEIIAELSKWVEEIPPVDQPQRFGNKAFREWYSRLENNAERLITKLVNIENATTELKPYLVESFGNPIRIDYGSGHEISFAAFLCCLCKVETFKEEDSVAIVFKVFVQYLELCRKLQTVYRMEPAGSHGVWGLDDFQFIPYIWGSAQLLDHPTIEPSHFPDRLSADRNASDYLFFRCIQYIHETKTGPFSEHSNQLWNISGLKHWSKVNSGLIKMYEKEVLGEFPIVQHFPCGSLLSFECVAP